MHCFKFTSCGIELDAKLVVDLLKKEDGSPNNNDVIVADCKEGLKKILIIRITYSFRKINECIDALDKMEALLSQDFIVFSIPPPDISLWPKCFYCFCCLVNEFPFLPKKKKILLNKVTLG